MTHRMLNLVPATGLCLAMVACATSPSSNKPYELEIRETVRFAIPSKDGISLVDFMKVGQRVTGKPFTYSKQEIAGSDQRVRLVGTLNMKRSDFYPFMTAMLHVKGFECATRSQGGTEIVEIRKIATSDQKPKKTAARIKLEHAGSRDVLAALKVIHAKSPHRPRLVVVSHVDDNSLLIEGPKDQIASAKDLIALLDQPM